MGSDLIFLGCKGDDVVLVQTRINFHGFGVLDVDGQFGKLTQEAVIQFQMAQGLSPDGIVGPNTMKELMDDYDQPVSGKAEIDMLVKNKSLASVVSKASPDIKSVMDLAISDIGKKEYPNGSNKGPEISHLVDGYHEYWNISESQYPALPWCAMAVSRWIFIGLDLSSWTQHPFKAFFGGCSQIEDWGKNCGKHFTVKEDGPPPVGSIFLMSRASSGSDASSSAKAGHTGLIASIDGDVVSTIEGNVSNSVASRERKLSEITGYVLWWE